MSELPDPLIIQTLEPLVSPERQRRIRDVIAHRHYGLCVVLEGIYDDGNMSAVLRTCDALGVQRVNLVLSDDHSFKSDRQVSLGSHKWLDLHIYTSAQACAEALHGEGYLLAATHLDASVPLGEIDFGRRVALILGNERYGVSEAMVALSDARVRIPMYGFVQSFNISVAAAICVYHGMTARRAATGLASDLSTEQAAALQARFLRRSVKTSDLLLSRLEP